MKPPSLNPIFLFFCLCTLTQADLVITSDDCTLDCLGGVVPSSPSGSYSTDCQLVFDSETVNGILLSGRRNVTIRSCVISGYTRGIYLSGSNDSRIVSCAISGNSQEGVSIVSSHRNNVSSSNVSGCTDGVELASSTGNFILGNRVFNHSDDGLDLDAGADGNSIIGNTVFGNYYGMVLTSALNNLVSYNSVHNHSDFGKAGILLYTNSDYNTVSDNNVTWNFAGISLINASGSNISDNVVCQDILLSNDFLISGGVDNSGAGNFCETPNGWSDTGFSGCQHDCSSPVLTTTSSTTTSTTSTSTTSTTTSTSTSTSTTTLSQIHVDITASGFTPENINVSLDDVVNWTNRDVLVRRIVDSGLIFFDSGNISPSQSFSYNVINSSNISYQDYFNASMTGSITFTVISFQNAFVTGWNLFSFAVI